MTYLAWGVLAIVPFLLLVRLGVGAVLLAIGWVLRHS